MDNANYTVQHNMYNELKRKYDRLSESQRNSDEGVNLIKQIRELNEKLSAIASHAPVHSTSHSNYIQK